MIGSDPHRRIRDAIADHFAGSGGPSREREMRAHLPVCAECHAHYEQHLLLASLDPVALPSEARLGRGLGFQPRHRSGRTIFGLVGVCGAAFAVMALMHTGGRSWPPGGRGPRPDVTESGAPAGAVAEGAGREIAARGAGSEIAARGAAMGTAAARLPEVQIYRISYRTTSGRRGARAEEAGDAVYPGEELAFAYRNPAGKERLLVFAVDEHGHVYWYHPGWSRAAENPTAVPISAEPGLHELPAAVLHKFDGERIMIHALFTDRELTVRQVEAAVAAAAARQRAPGASDPLELPGATDVVRPLRVVR